MKPTNRQRFTRAIRYLLWPALVIIGLNIENLSIKLGIGSLLADRSGDIVASVLAVVQSGWVQMPAMLVAGAALGLWVDRLLRKSGPGEDDAAIPDDGIDYDDAKPGLGELIDTVSLIDQHSSKMDETIEELSRRLGKLDNQINEPMSIFTEGGSRIEQIKQDVSLLIGFARKRINIDLLTDIINSAPYTGNQARDLPSEKLTGKQRQDLVSFTERIIQMDETVIDQEQIRRGFENVTNLSDIDARKVIQENPRGLSP